MKKECANCGVRNDTVDLVPDTKIYLCDYCIKEAEAMDIEEIEEKWGD